MALAPDDFPPERLEHRLTFLHGRAEAHLASIENAEGRERPEDSDRVVLARACAATLYRDAACVALLLEKTSEARKLLHLSGRHFLDLGLPVGASLIALAGERGADEELVAHDDLIAAVQQQWAPREAREKEDRQRPIAAAARSEPTQLLAMMQTDWLIDARRPGAKASVRHAPLRDAIRRNAGHPAGSTGLTIGSYTDLAEWLSEQMGSVEYVPEVFTGAMTTMMSIRAEQLRAARTDRFHWRMLARPAEVIDLDATILMYLATDLDGDAKKGVEPLVERAREKDRLLDAPLLAAMALRQDQWREMR